MANSKKTEEASLKVFVDALDEIQRTKGIDKEELISAVEAALISAYKKDYKGGQNARVEIDRQTGAMKVYAQRVVSEEVQNPVNEISLQDAKSINISYELGDIVEDELDPKDFGRVAAQNAKQIIIQRIKESERNMIYDTFSEKKDELVTGVVSRLSKNDVYVEIGKCEGIMNAANQIPSEQYFSGMRIKVYIVDVLKTNKGPQVIVSRSHPSLIKRLFEFEIPEIFDGTVEIISIAREAGSRTKVAVYAKESQVDAVGSCVGHKGTRIQNILNEIGSERVDVVEYSADITTYIKNSLSPADTLEVFADEDTRTALVVVDDSQLSLAIGKDGQNVRLAAKLTGYKIDIKNRQQYQQMLSELDDIHEEESETEEAFLGNDEAYIGDDDTSEDIQDNMEIMENEEV